MSAAEQGRTRVTMLLLADPSTDIRVIKTVRSLRDAGYSVTLCCLTRQQPAMAVPDLHGATVQWVTAPRPVARMATWLARLRRRPTANQPRAGAPARAANDTGSILRDLRALLGTLWLNLILARAAKIVPADVIHANDLDTLPAGVWLGRRGTPLIYDAHELYPEMLASFSPLYAGLWRVIEHHLIRRTAAAITINDAIAMELRRRHRLATTPAVVMNCPSVQPVPSRDEQGTATVLLYHGVISAERGLELLVRAMPHVDPRATLHIRGRGPLQPVLEALAAELGIAERVVFLDLVPPDRIVASMSGVTMGVIPIPPVSLNAYLCSPNKLYECLMGGLAVVTSDLPELRRTVLETGSGAVYPAGDHLAMAHAINDLLGDPARLAQCQVAARQAAEQRYNWEMQARVLLRVYRQAAGNARQGQTRQAGLASPKSVKS